MTSQQTPARAKASTGGGRRRVTPFNKFMLAELARLSEAHPDLSHQERFKMATENWKAKR